MKKISVEVRLKEEVLDPQGDAVGRALAQEGFGSVSRVRVGKLIELEIEESELSSDALESTLQAMCEKLLVNPVIEDYSFKIQG